MTYRYSVGWGEFLVTNHEIVYVHIDGRGTAMQSNEMMFEVYRNLGTAEIQDQIEVIKVRDGRSRHSRVNLPKNEGLKGNCTNSRSSRQGTNC